METTIVATPEADVKQGSALERASKMITPPPLSSELNQIRENIKKCEAALQGLLPIEETARFTLEAKLKELKNLKSNSKYPKLSLEVLKWRNKQGFPLFALFNYGEDGKFSISSTASPILPTSLRNYFGDVREKLKLQAQSITQKAKSGIRKIQVAALTLSGIFYVAFLVDTIMGPHSMGLRFNVLMLPLSVASVLTFAILSMLGDEIPKTFLTITAQYTGIIPSSVRQKIKDAEENKEFESIYILAEIPEWKMQQKVIPKPDPLVLGYRDGSLYLIAVYDTTPTEEYVAREFAI